MKPVLLLSLLTFLSGCGQGKSTDDWVGQLQNADPAARLEAIKALGENQGKADQAVPALTEALKDENAFVRRDAARALGKVGPEAGSAVPFLVRALHDREGSVRRAAAEALKKVDPAVAARTVSLRR